MKVDIFIHGVPNGQRIWGSAGSDQVINQFYGSGSEEQTKFLAEVRKSGGENFCYYSILKYKNVSAENGRAGSYFGLTIRMDMVCTKVNVLFSILDIVYQTAIVGNFIKQDGDRLKFIVGDFHEKEQTCKGIVDKIMSMLGNSVGGKDFISITPAMLSGRGTSKINLSECSASDALNALVRNGGIAVSPDYPSAQMSAYITKKEAELNNVRQQSQQDINNIRQQAARELQEQQQRSDNALQQTIEKSRLDIEQIKRQYADTDKKLLAYDKQIKQMQRENRDLSTNVSNLQRAVQERDNTIAKLRRNTNGSTSEPYSSHHRSPSVNAIAAVVIPFVNLLIVIALAAIVLLKMPGDNTKTIQQISNDITYLKEKMISLDNESLTSAASVSVEGSTNSDIVSIECKQGYDLSLGNTNTVKAITANNTLAKGGSWSVSSDLVDIKDNHDGIALLTAKKKGSVIVTYSVNGHKITRTFKIA